ncbi:uncharacterized protein LOC103509014 [Diaphorina citri]|uniref:Uncharacterized protein LOC103509014 n=1 Tax=Diaphorina citri TaxID=121845 RepID=A0A1S3D0W8_DIACI|nr:uncharacterized protein LOC103509014 [Diaphorina citri]KAI5711745.1 hypothetical protein M8J75_002834 [Diaphorina citri]
MANSIFSQKGAIAAIAAGAGALIGAAGVLLYHQLCNQKAQNEMHEEIVELGNSIEKIQRELESVRKNILSSADRRRLRRVSNSTSATSEMYSANEDDDEFFDFSSDQEGTINRDSDVDT